MIFLRLRYLCHSSCPLGVMSPSTNSGVDFLGEAIPLAMPYMAMRYIVIRRRGRRGYWAMRCRCPAPCGYQLGRIGPDILGRVDFTHNTIPPQPQSGEFPLWRLSRKTQGDEELWRGRWRRTVDLGESAGDALYNFRRQRRRCAG